MILEVAILNVRAGQGEAFTRAFRQASSLIASIPGYVSHELQNCVETPDRYLLLVQWQTLEAHTIGFRQSAAYQEWKARHPHVHVTFPLRDLVVSSSKFQPAHPK